MLGLLFLAFLVIPIVELYLFVQVADSIGFGSTLFWIVAVSVIGAWLVKREGLGALRRANDKARRGKAPTDELISGILILFAGALMLTPGFLTDAVGLLMLFPLTRMAFVGLLRRRFAFNVLSFNRNGTGPIGFGRFDTGAGTGGTRKSDVWDVDSWEDPPDEPDALS